MRLLALYFAGLTLSLAYCCGAHGQGCVVSLQSFYDVYTTVSIVQTTIYTSVTVDGYASMPPSAGCSLQGVTHQGAAYNLLSTTGGWVYGPTQCPSCYINVSNNQNIKGSPGVAYPFHWQGQVKCSKAGVFFARSATTNITDVWAVISQRTSGTVSSDDAAIGAYDSAEGTTNLGLMSGSNPTGCVIGNETIGTIAPPNYTSYVTLHRFVVADMGYRNSTQTGGVTNFDDTSDPALRDDDPQSGNSGGKVYDLDAPGIGPPNVDGNTYRYRGNFYEFAALSDGTVISSQFTFYVRVSCKKTASGYQVVNDVPNDNQIGTGTTPLTWNLQ